jgi:PKD repeat protein
MPPFRRRSQDSAPSPRGRGKSRGQSLVEFALILPVLMLILLITIDFGRVYLGWVTLNNAARIAANYAASGQPPLTTAQQIEYRAVVASETKGINCDLPNPIPNPTYPGSTGTIVGGRAVVALSCSFNLITPFLGNIFPGGVVAVGASADFPIRSGVLANVAPGQTLPPLLPPNQDFTPTPATGPFPLTVTVTLGPQLGGPAQTWDWSFGDGTTASQVLQPSHTYTTPATATYPVTLTETNGAGSSSYTNTVSVVYSPLPVAAFYGTVPASAPCTTIGAPNSEQCGGPDGSTIYFTWPVTVDFTDTSTNTTGAAYSWTFGDGSTATGANPSHPYTNPGAYTVTETVATAAGSNTASRTAYVNAGCVIPVFVGHDSGSAAGLWTGAHYSNGNLDYYQPGKGAPYAATVPSPSYPVGLQNPQGGLFTIATGSAGNSSCTSTARVAPTGANPKP